MKDPNWSKSCTSFNVGPFKAPQSYIYAVWLVTLTGESTLLRLPNACKHKKDPIPASRGGKNDGVLFQQRLKHALTVSYKHQCTYSAVHRLLTVSVHKQHLHIQLMPR